MLYISSPRLPSKFDPIASTNFTTSVSDVLLLLRILFIIANIFIKYFSVRPGNITTTQHRAWQERGSARRDEVLLFPVFQKILSKRSSSQKDMNSSKGALFLLIQGSHRRPAGRVPSRAWLPQRPLHIQGFGAISRPNLNCHFFEFREMRTWSPSLKRSEKFSAVGQMNR